MLACLVGIGLISRHLHRIIYMKKKGKEQKLQFTQDLDQFRVKLKVEPGVATFYKKSHVYTITGLPPNSSTRLPHCLR